MKALLREQRQRTARRVGFVVVEGIDVLHPLYPAPDIIHLNSIPHLPAAGEVVIFDRSWYNRAGVEPVMGFCTPEEHEHFLEETPNFERMPVNAGIHLFKFWLNIGREMQLKRFHDRRHDPLKVWKLSPMDIASLNKWDDYTQKRDLMLQSTHTPQAPWTVVRANDKRRARINIIRRILTELPYSGKDEKAIGDIDGKVLGEGYSALLNWDLA